MSDHDFIQDLRSELVRAAEERWSSDSSIVQGPENSKRRRSYPLLFAAAAVVAVLVGAVLFHRSAGSTHDVEVAADGDGVVISLTDRSATPQAVEQAAADFGVEVSVADEPVGPSNVGRFVVKDAGLPGGVSVLNRDGNGFSAVKIPFDQPERVDLGLGRPANPGETWAVPSDALAPGEIAACLDLLGADAQEAVALLEERGAMVQWIADSSDEVVDAPTVDGDASIWSVVAIQAISPDKVVVKIAADGSMSQNQATSQALHPGC